MLIMKPEIPCDDQELAHPELIRVANFPELFL